MAAAAEATPTTSSTASSASRAIRVTSRRRQPRRRAGAARARAAAGQGRAPRDQTTVAAGTGFIINKDGLILTNNHVIDGAMKIQVRSSATTTTSCYDAKLVGRDQLTDSALIQLTEKPNRALPEAKFGDSSQMAAGDWVMAIGNPFNQGWTVTVGVDQRDAAAFSRHGSAARTK